MTGALPPDLLPAGFTYPAAYLRVLELGLTDLEPWWLLGVDLLAARQQGLSARYPDRDLVLFAARADRDDVACWDASRSEGVVYIVHDFSSPGWEERGQHESFRAWFLAAAAEMLDFE